MEAKDYLKKAENSLKAAQLCSDNGLYDDAANRSYFAVLQIAIGLLRKHSLFPVTRRLHAWVQANFSKEFIRKRKIFPQRMAGYLSDLRDQRETADYKLQFVSRKSGKVNVRKASEFYEMGQREMRKSE